ncbi:MAG: FliM/FliN family flagellar motor switch protein [Planctomycetaceae bacterium]|nr:FliM/FliN family flagellar motor switch protein [Planctomycetaceae bacterium]MCA9044075.1 FliM/FliN family flagellar motor switch protein [Planctomycetaceae bacterium]
MNDLQPQTLDFYRPRRPAEDVWNMLQKWCQATCVVLQEQWNEVLKNPIQLACHEIRPCEYQGVASAMQPGSLGLHLKVTPARVPSIVVLSGRTTQGLLADLLDIPGTEWPEERELTPVESSMMEVLFERVAFAIGDSYPGAQSTPCRFIEAMNRPERTRILSAQAEYYLILINFTSRFGTEPIAWILPRKEVDEQLEDGSHSSDSDTHAGLSVLESLARRIPVDITFELGSTEIPMSAAMNLALGDVIVLDNSIYRPLTMSVENVPKWQGYPLRKGPRQAFQVSEKAGK